MNELYYEVRGYIPWVVVLPLFALAFWYVFVKAPKDRALSLAPWAQKRGLAFTPPQSLGAHTVGIETSILQGAFQGVPLMLRSSREVNSRRAGINGQTEIMFRAFAPSPARFNLVCIRAPAAPAPDTVRTGDPMLDARVSLRSDDPRSAISMLNPHVRAVLPGVVYDGAPVTVTYGSGEIVLRLGAPIWEEPQLDRALALAVVLARA